MNNQTHAKILFTLSILAFLAIFAPGVLIWIGQAIVTLAIALSILSLFFGFALLLAWGKK
jgi:hypothetical protein